METDTFEVLKYIAAKLHICDAINLKPCLKP